MSKTPVLAITLGDQAGSSPELAVKVFLERKEDYIPVLIGNRKQFDSILPVVEGSEKLKVYEWNGQTRPEKKAEDCYTYFYNIDVVEGGIIPKTITAESGKLIFEMLRLGVEFQNAKVIDGFLMAPITKAALHEAGYDFTSEFEVYDHLYNTTGCASVIRCDEYFRSTVVGHCAFREIADKITKESLKGTTYRLANIMDYFRKGKRCRIGVAALNPHAGENGLFGTEEITILTPAINELIEEGYDMEGPWPADTALNKIHAGDAEGIIYLYHDQGNIAQKACEFGGLVLIYVNIPGNIVSVGHGPAYDLAGSGKANADNMILSMSSLYKIVSQKLLEE